MRRDRQGFTLLELMMVVVIIGILATIALPQYFRSAERARTAEASALLGSIRSAESRFRAQSSDNIYTSTLNQLDIDVPVSTLWTYSVTGTASGADAQAIRQGTGPCGGKIMEIDLDTGTLCSNDPTCAATWGIKNQDC